MGHIGAPVPHNRGPCFVTGSTEVAAEVIARDHHSANRSASGVVLALALSGDAARLHGPRSHGGSGSMAAAISAATEP